MNRRFLQRKLTRLKRVVTPVTLLMLLIQSRLLYQILHQQGRLLLRIESLEDWRAGLAGRPSPAGGDAGPPPAPLSTVPASMHSSPPSSEEEIELTIGMATYNDFDGVYFTLQALRLYQDLERTELLVIDNYGCDETKNLVEDWLNGRYIRATDAVGTAAPRELVFREARGKAVLCCDCHVLFVPGAIARLKQYYREHPDCRDLLQGPLLFDDAKHLATHFDPVWQAQMWGTWGSDQRGQEQDGEPFEIPMQGLGVFSCLKTAWPGFHPEFRGFGGEEGYIHEKFRRAGGRCLCLPWLRWMHRFTRASGPTYPLTVEEKLRNYLLGHSELGLDLDPVLQHFSEFLPREQVMAVTEQTLGKRRAGSSQSANGVPGPRQDQKQAAL
jgi:hypothetical protein